MIRLYFVYRDDPGPVLYSTSGRIEPDLSFDSGLKSIAVPDGTPNEPSNYTVASGGIVAKTGTGP